MTAASPTTSAATLAGRQTRHWTLAKAQLKATEFLDELDTKGINAEYVSQFMYWNVGSR